jgi:hypothetical protein
VFYKFKENNYQKLQVVVNLWRQLDSQLELDYPALSEDEEYYFHCYGDVLYPKLCLDFVMLTLMSAGDDVINGLVAKYVDLSRVMAEVRAWKAHSDDAELDEALSQLVV